MARLGAISGQAMTSPYRFAVTLVIANIEDKVSDLRTAMTSGEIETIGRLIEAISKALTGLGSEVELSANSWATQKLNAIRNEVHALSAA